VFLAALPPVQFVGGRATSENIPRQSLGTSTGNIVEKFYNSANPRPHGAKAIAVRLRANSSISTSQVRPLRGVRGVFVFLPRTNTPLTPLKGRT